MFLNAIMLAGIGGAAVPLVLHLLSRARYRSIDWGAMMFLGGADPRQQNATRLKQLILLLLRMAMVALLAIAMARPVADAGWGLLGGPRPVSAVILLDRSGSMGTDEGGQSRLAIAQRSATSVLAALGRGDEVTLTPLGGPRPEPPVPTTDLQRVASAVADLKLAADRVDIASALADARRAFDADHAATALPASVAPNRLLVLITDRQASNWSGVDETFAATWADGFAGAPPRMVVIPVGGESRDNLAIERVAVVNPPAIREAMSDVEIRIHNYGPTFRANVPVSLGTGGRELFRTSVNLPPDSSATVNASVRLGNVGSQLLVARTVGAAGPAGDDSLACAVDVVEPIGVLIVSGDERDRSLGMFRSESDFLRLALAPYQTTGRRGTDSPGADPSVVEVVPADAFTEPDRARHRVVVLANVPTLTPQQARRLEQFVYVGGGLLIAPGGLVRHENYNQLLWRDGAGLMPAQLSAPVPPDPSAATSVLGLDLSHPVFRFLRSRPDPLPAATIGRYFPAAAVSPDARVPASLRSGSPLLLERAFGRGRVLLLTTPLDADWGTLPLSNFYLPFVQSTTRYLSGGWAADRNLAPSEPIVAELPDAVGERAVVALPDGTRQNVDLARPDGPAHIRPAEIRFATTHLPGRYEVRYRTEPGDRPPDRTLHFVVRPPPEESDLSALTEPRWRQLETSLGFTRLDPTRPDLAEPFLRSAAGRELWLPLLAIVPGLGCVELLLARWWTGDTGRRGN